MTEPMIFVQLIYRDVNQVAREVVWQCPSEVEATELYDMLGKQLDDHGAGAMRTFRIVHPEHGKLTLHVGDIWGVMQFAPEHIPPDQPPDPDEQPQFELPITLGKPEDEVDLSGLRFGQPRP